MGGVERLSGLLHEDFRWTAHVGVTYDRSEYVRRNTEGHTVWRSQELSRAEVVVVGDTAVLLAEVTDVVLSEDDKAEAFRMPMTQVWIRLDGRWTCLAGHAGPRRSGRTHMPRSVWSCRGVSRQASPSPGCTPHMLRHTFVTTMLDAGVDLRDVQIAARHADPRTTMRYDRARKNLDRHPNYILAAYMTSGT